LEFKNSWYFWWEIWFCDEIAKFLDLSYLLARNDGFIGDDWVVGFYWTPLAPFVKGGITHNTHKIMEDRNKKLVEVAEFVNSNRPTGDRLTMATLRFWARESLLSFTRWDNGYRYFNLEEAYREIHRIELLQTQSRLTIAEIHQSMNQWRGDRGVGVGQLRIC